jgi:eukaryotic-like serine/threonine-protein kinase
MVTEPTRSEQGQSSGLVASPQRIAGRYEILGLLGTGGMGSVYRVRDVELDEVVALKMLRRDLADSPGMLDRFRQEVKLARRVTHRNVARTFDFGDHEGEKFLTMECVDGESLHNMLARIGPMPAQQVVGIGCALCDGLAAAHAAGVVHRDLKPENVMLDKGGRVVITDFGIARASSTSAVQTSGFILGSPAYMSPEQLTGESEIDARADIYALGMILFEILTQRRAWPGSAAIAAAMARLRSPPPDPRSVRTDVPAPVAEVVVRCMQIRREDRYASAAEVHRALLLARSRVSMCPQAPMPTPVATATNSQQSTADQSVTQVTLPPPEATVAKEPMSITLAAPSRVPELKTVAVLPFRNAGAAEDEYLAEGLTEDLTDTLSVTAGLRVRPRGALGVKIVVEGSIRRSGAAGAAYDPSGLQASGPASQPGPGGVRAASGGLRVTVRVISVEDGFQLFAKRFDSSPEGFLTLSDNAARAIAEALTVDVGSRDREAPSDPRAIDLYLRARHQLRRLWYGDAAPAVALFEEALAHSPGDPSILSGYAVACARLMASKGAGPEQLAQAQQAAERAIASAPLLGEPWVALATVRFSACDPVGAVPALRTALQRAPSLAKAHELLGRILLEAGLVDEAIFRLETALSLDASELMPRWDLARARALLGDWATTGALLELPVEDEANRFHKTVMRARFGLWRGTPFPIDDMPLTAETIPVQYARILRDVLATSRLTSEQRAFLRAKSGRSEPGSRLRPLFSQMYAEILGFLGEDETVLVAIGHAVEAGLFDALWMQRCPLLESVRSDHRFAPLRARVDERAAAILAAVKT